MMMVRILLAVLVFKAATTSFTFHRSWYIIIFFISVVVNVAFSRSSYSFSESAGTGSYELRLSNEILQPLTVNVVGGKRERDNKDYNVTILFFMIGPGSQLSSVIISGSVVNQNITFPAGSSASISRTFPIMNDQTALETVESYSLNIGSHFFPDPDAVNLGGGAGILIADDDGIIYN